MVKISHVMYAPADKRCIVYNGVDDVASARRRRAETGKGGQTEIH